MTNPLEELRIETRQWLEENCPQSMRTPMPENELPWGGRVQDHVNPDTPIWMERMVEKGWATPDWPVEYGGGGLTSEQAVILEEEMERINARIPLACLGIMMLGPVLLECGTEQQKRQFLPDMAKGLVRWSQGFSEPGAGSDLASLKTKAEITGDQMVINGSKIWTSEADEADWIFCLVRTSNEGRPQQGVSFVLFDLESKGVERRPIKLINGAATFCQTFLDDVRVPVENMVGGLNKGWSGLMVSEELGGSGLGLQEIGPLIETAGKHMTPSPLLSTGLIAVSALGKAPENTYCRSLLEQIAKGSIALALAIEETHHHRSVASDTQAQRTADGWVLSGCKKQVADATAADIFLVTAQLEGTEDVGLFLVPGEKVAIEALSLIDCQDHGNIVLDQAALPEEAAVVVGPDAQASIDAILDVARVGIAAEMLGIAKSAFEMTIEYLKIREQFGQFIGSFQALQHRASTMFVELRLAEAALYSAFKALDEQSSEMAAEASKAKALVGETLHLVTNECIQLHGGIGMTDEHDAGLFLKRARVAEFLYGSVAFHRSRFATLRGL